MKVLQVLLALALVASLLIAAARPILAANAPANGYTLAWSSQDSGGAVAFSKTGYQLSGTIAQPDAQSWSGDHYAVNGGFWQPGLLEWLNKLFLPLILRDG